MRAFLSFLGVIAGSVLVGLHGCADASFNGGAGKASPTDNKTCTKPPCNPPPIIDQDDPNLVHVRYGQDVKPVVADYLFVLDNSVSMSDDATKVANGLAAIPKESFPESTRLAVMTTMVASDPLAGSLNIHPDVKKTSTAAGYPSTYTCIEKEPGFLSLVSKTSVDAFKSCAGVPPSYISKYSKEACDSGWFKPFDVNSANDRCFTAALQNPFYPVGCEAGLLALEQIIKRQRGAPLFRDNAAVSIIYVSDEQAGCSAAETRGDPTKAAETVQRIKSAIAQNSKVASVIINGIIPSDTNTTNVPSNTLSYVKVIDEIKGKWFDISNPAANYNSMVEQLIQATADVTPAEFFIPATAKKINSVEIDGVPTTNFKFDGASKVTIQGLDPQKTVDIIIRFE